jgi:hypothetical protein
MCHIGGLESPARRIVSWQKEKAMAGPYRERMIVPAYVENFFSYLKRRRALGRGVKGVLVVTVLVPSVLALAGVAVARLGSDEPEAPKTPTVSDPQGRPWGFVVSRARVEERSGPVPVLAPRPTRDDTPISPDALMRAMQAHAAEPLRACYTFALQEDDELDGELVVSVLVKKDGSVEAASGGPRQLRQAIGTCVERAIQAVDFGKPSDPVWVHVPLLFESR